MRILIVEDDFISRKVLLMILSKYGQCDVAANGFEAMQAFRLSVAEKRRYDLICLDIMMPGKDGFEVLREIRASERENGLTGLDGVKVIITTALDSPKDIMKAFREQCEAYLVKPIDEQKLVTSMKELGFKV